MSENSLPAAVVTQAVHGPAGMLSFFDRDDDGLHPTLLVPPFPVESWQGYVDEVVASPGLLVQTRREQTWLRIPLNDPKTAKTVAGVLADYGSRLLLAQQRGTTHRVGVVVGAAADFYPGRICKELIDRGLAGLIVPDRSWVPAVRPLADGRWQMLAPVTRRQEDWADGIARPMCHEDLLAYLGMPVTAPDDTLEPVPYRARPSDAMLRMWRRLYAAVGGLPLTEVESERQSGRVDVAPRVKDLTPWKAAARGIAMTAVLLPDILGLDLDSDTAAEAAFNIAVRFGLAIVVCPSGTPGHYTGVMRVHPEDRKRFADAIHDEHARICADRGLEDPDRMVARGSHEARARMLGSCTAKAGRAAAYAVGVLVGIDEDGRPLAELIHPEDVGDILGLGGPATQWTATEDDKASRRARKVNKVVAPQRAANIVTVAEVISKFALSGAAVEALELPRAELVARSGGGSDLSRWMWALLTPMVARGATDTDCLSAVEAAAGLANPDYKGRKLGSTSLAKRVAYEAEAAREWCREQHEKRAAEGGDARDFLVESPVSPAFLEQLDTMWSTWKGHADELVQAARELDWARQARRVTNLGMGVVRMGLATAADPNTASARFDRQRDLTTVVRVKKAHRVRGGGWAVDRYDLVGTPAQSPFVGRPPLDAVLVVLDDLLAWTPGVTPAGLLAMASLRHAGKGTLSELRAAWGWDRRKAVLTVQQLVDLKLVERDGEAVVWLDAAVDAELAPRARERLNAAQKAAALRIEKAELEEAELDALGARLASERTEEARDGADEPHETTAVVHEAALAPVVHLPVPASDGRREQVVAALRPDRGMAFPREWPDATAEALDAAVATGVDLGLWWATAAGRTAQDAALVARQVARHLLRGVPMAVIREAVAAAAGAHAFTLTVTWEPGVVAELEQSRPALRVA